MSLEFDTQNNLAIEQLERGIEADNLLSIIATGRHVPTNMNYDLHFSTHPTGPIIELLTLDRSNFPNITSEMRYKEALINFGQEVRKVTGGSFVIHPFYGIVVGSSFGCAKEGYGNTFPGEKLSMNITLSSFKEQFPPELSTVLSNTILYTEDAVHASVQRQQARARNLNVFARECAIKDGDYDGWTEQFEYYNNPPLLQAPMQFTAQNVASALSLLRFDGFEIDDLQYTSVR